MGTKTTNCVVLLRKASALLLSSASDDKGLFLCLVLTMSRSGESDEEFRRAIELSKQEQQKPGGDLIALDNEPSSSAYGGLFDVSSQGFPEQRLTEQRQFIEGPNIEFSQTVTQNIVHSNNNPYVTTMTTITNPGNQSGFNNPFAVNNNFDTFDPLVSNNPIRSNRYLQIH
jgi:hypothetical protein